MKGFWARGLLAGVLLVGGTLALVDVGRAVRAQERPSASATKPGASEAKPATGGEQEVDETAEYRHSTAVQKLGGMMGMDAEQSSTAFEWVNFLLLSVGVGWLLVKLLPKTFQARESTIQKELVEARTATEEASARLSGVEERLAKLDGQIAALRTQAEQDSQRDEQRIKASLEDEKTKILAAAEQEIAAATMLAQKALQQYAAELAIEQAARKLVVSAETDRLLVQSFAQRLTGDESKKGQN